MTARRICFCLGAVLVLRTLLASAQPRALATADAVEIASGKRIFHAQCARCHGTEGTGGAGPSLQRSVLRHAKDDADLVATVRNGIAGTEMPGFQWSLTDTMAWQTAAYVRSLGRVAPEPVRGNAERGAAIYAARSCDACHILDGRGKAVGPELTSVGALRGVAYLRDAILKPEAEHPPGFLVVNAERRSGGEVRGIRIGEDAFWIHLRDANGTVHDLEKKDLLRLERDLNATLMPSYASLLSGGDLDDLVAYLASRRGEP
jgi:putative heme-binding domain-containing protein